MVYFSNEPCTKELLDLFANGLAFLAAEMTKLLLDRFRPGPDVEFVLGDLPRNPRHVRGFPSERIEVRSEEVDERAFLFRIERRPDTERAAVVEKATSVASLAGWKEQAACLVVSGISGSSVEGSAASFSDRMSVSVN